MPEIHLAAAIVVYEDKVLIVRRSGSEKLAPRVWGVPCGKIESGESETDAVLRELREETGLRGKILRPVGQSTFRSRWHRRSVSNLQWNYLVRPEVNPADTDEADMPKVRLPQEDQRYKWVPASEITRIPGLDLHNLQTIQQGLAVLGAVESRR